MAVSNYPNGFLNGVTIREVPITQMYPGKIFWVNSTGVVSPSGVKGSNSNPGTYTRPFSTLDYAVGQCVASRGDIICLMPGYTDTVSSAGAIALDVAGICVYGMGYGTKKATITLDTATTAAITVGALNISIVNCNFSANFADIVTCFSYTTGKNFALIDCDFMDTATNMNFLYIVDTDTTDNRGDGIYVKGCSWVSPDLACVSFLKMDGATDGVTFEDNYINLGVNNSKGALIAGATGKAMTNLHLRRNEVYRLNTTNTGMLISTDSTACSGIIRDNVCVARDATNNLIIPASTKLACFNNYYTGAADASGFLNPVADS